MNTFSSPDTLTDRLGTATQIVALLWSISVSSRPLELILDVERRSTFPLSGRRVG